MVNTEILEGLRQAIARGEPIQKAMQSFINAGYNQAEVEEASYNLNNSVQQPTLMQTPTPQPTLQKFLPLPTQQTSQQDNTIPQQQIQVPRPTQQIQKDIGTGWIILLIVILLILLGALFGMIFFKDSLTSFFNGLI